MTVPNIHIAKHGLEKPIPSITQVRHALDKLPCYVREKGRLTGSKLRQLRQYVKRDWNPDWVMANDVWVGDGHLLNRLRQQIIDCMKYLPTKKRIPTALKEQVLDIVRKFDGFVDIRCLNSWLLFSGKQVSSFDELAKCELYNRVRLSDYKLADGYLDGLNIISEDFRTLLPKYSAQEKTLFLLDPPYLCTQQQAYALADYFGMTNFLELMTMVRPPYIFFSSTRSELLDYMKYIEKYDVQTWERVGDFETISIQATLNPSSTYEDNMLYRFE